MCAIVFFAPTYTWSARISGGGGNGGVVIETPEIATTNKTIQTTDTYTLLLASPTSAGLNVYLPDASDSSMDDGKRYTIKNVTSSTGVVTVNQCATCSGQTIDRYSTFTIRPLDSYDFFTSDTKWWVK